ncbi:hypothetical protein ACP4OV_000435 [Aristida adscensionis]
MKLQKQSCDSGHRSNVNNTSQDSPDSGQLSNVNNTSQDKCSNEHSNTEVIAASSQSNGPVQNVPHTHPDGAATLSTKTKQITSDGKSLEQHDCCIIRDASCAQKACKSIPAPTNAIDGLLWETGQATELRTELYCKPCPDNDTVTIAQTTPTEWDLALSNGTLSSNEVSTSGNEAKEIEPIKQHELLLVKNLPAKSIGDDGNA